MNCEQVEELLSAYLDNMLAPEERRQVANHLQSCRKCTQMLADFRRNDALLARLPRVTPDDTLRERIFTSPDFLELTGEFPDNIPSARQTVPRMPVSGSRRDTPGRPHLVAIPGGRSTAPQPTVKVDVSRRRDRHRTMRALIAAIAAALVIAIGLGAYAGISYLSHQGQSPVHPGFTPIENPQQGAPQPLSAGVRIVFLRGNTLLSERSDGSSTQPDQLTPSGVSVAPGWAVAMLPGRMTGNLLAYIDLNKARVHVIRSDGQQDTTINPPLLNASVSPASIQDSATWATIVNSLIWSPDGTRLAFVADPTGSGQTHLYIYSTITAKTTQVVVNTPGSVSHPTWSPDSARLAFEVNNQNATAILDYNTNINRALVIASGIGTAATAGQGVLTLDWSPDVNAPAITWSIGAIGHVRSLWVHAVGIDSSSAQEILSGDFAQALYSRSGHNGAGSWMIITTIAGRAGDIWRIDVTPGAPFVQLTRGRQVNFARWSPDGAWIAYLDSLSEGVGTFHIVNASAAIDATVASSVAYTPAPAWSIDSQQVAFSTGTRVGVASVQSPANPRYLSLKGTASALSWSGSTTSLNQLVVAMNNVQQGIYFINTQRNTTYLADKLGADGPILWTVIP